MSHPFRVACDEHTITARTAEAAQRVLAGIEKLGACSGPHRVEELIDGVWAPVGAIVTLDDGSTMAVPPRWRDRVRGLDEHGNWLVPLFDPDIPLVDEAFRDYLVPLTSCCGTDGTGSSTPTGVACRGCYRTVPAYFGAPGRVAPGKAVAR
jgi:hypothetical protein